MVRALWPPNDIPENGAAYGAILALSEIWRRVQGTTAQKLGYDVSGEILCTHSRFKMPVTKRKFIGAGDATGASASNMAVSSLWVSIPVKTVLLLCLEDLEEIGKYQKGSWQP